VPGGAVGFLIVVNLLVFVLGFFIDFFEIAFILLPLLAPVAAKLGIDPVWFAVMIGMNMQTSFLTPPFGFALFYLRSVAPASIRTADIYRGVAPFVGVQLVALALLIAFPGLTDVLDPDRAKKVDTEKVEIRIEPPEGVKGDEDRAAEEIERQLRGGK
ncbi:MAG: TRAP transporter large permease subunit, partial [Burkholderiales bacterium]|nr:TRAP transporter large permease subunit [Burkholderiales bacterium]